MLSLIASKLRDENDAPIREIGPPSNLRVLTSAVIFGKNGSGKSTLMSALEFVANFTATSAMENDPSAELPYDPSLLIPEYSEKPSFHRILFSVESAVYNFGFSYNNNQIFEEFLEVADKSARFRKVYERNWIRDRNEYDYTFGEALSGTRKIWAENTRKNALYISTAVQLNSKDLEKPFNWLSKFVRSISIGTSGRVYTAKRCQEDEDFCTKVVQFLQAMDINIVGLEFREKDDEDLSWGKTFAPEFIEKMRPVIEKSKSERNFDVYFKKIRSDGQVCDLAFSRESTGTQALFRLAGPLFDVLENGYCLLVDELNTSLHPLIVRFLIDLFADEKVNKKRAQLIFTSHDVSVLRENVFRRDQVWLVENDGTASVVIPLSDYSPRKREAIERGYLMGRYGGVPTVMSNFIKEVI
jgi:hypothetical protein